MPEQGITYYRGVPINAYITKMNDGSMPTESWTVEIGPTINGSSFSKSLMDAQTADGYIEKIQRVIDKSFES